MPEMMHIALVSAVSDRMADLREQIEAGGDMRVTVFAAHAPGLSVDEAERIDLAGCFEGETAAVFFSPSLFRAFSPFCARGVPGTSGFVTGW